MPQIPPLTGKVALVTGGALRIGRCIAETLAAAGARVAVHCNRSTNEAADLVRELNQITDGCLWLKADLSDGPARDRLIPAVIKQAGQLDILVNNASVYRRCPLLRLDEAGLREDWEINFAAPFLLMRHFAAMVASGAIINLLDQRVAKVDPGAGSYGLAKKSLRDATEAAALEWAPRIRVNAVAPGLILPPPGVEPEKMVPLLRQVPMRRPSPVSEVGAACLYLARTETVTGQVLYVDGGLHLTGPLHEKS